MPENPSEGLVAALMMAVAVCEQLIDVTTDAEMARDAAALRNRAQAALLRITPIASDPRSKGPEEPTSLD